MKRKKILAVASSGGHWSELQRIIPALEGAELVYACVSSDYARSVPGHRFHTIPDASARDKVSTALCVLRMFQIMLRERPDVVITTGSGPGMVSLRVAKLFRARTIWIESISSVDVISVSGRHAKPAADLFLVQWPHLADKNQGIEYVGAIL